MTDRDIDEAIDALKEICDPMGHELLDALRATWKRYEQLTRTFEAVLDTGDHSKVAELRVMPGGKPT